MHLMHHPSRFQLTACWAVLILTIAMHAGAQGHRGNSRLKLLDALSTETKAIGEIYVFNAHFALGPDPMFRPEDMREPGPSKTHLDNIVKWENNIYFPIDGTGRLYRLSSTGSTPAMERVDSTSYFGNTFYSVHFTYRDTLFSLGGYGYWRWNGHLRYYDRYTSSWSLMPLNQELIVRQFPFLLGVWFDKQKGDLWYTEHLYEREWLRNGQLQPGAINDTCRIWSLDVGRRTWSAAGLITHAAKDLILNATRIGSCRQGELLYQKEKGHVNIFVVDYAGNKIQRLSQASSVAIDRFIDDPTLSHTRFISYALDSGFVIKNIRNESLRINLPDVQLLATGIKIYDPGGMARSSGNNLMTWSIMALVASLLFVVFGTVLYIKSKTMNSHTTISMQTIFTLSELELLKTISRRPDCTICTDELNALLGTSRKTDDIQRKVRSESIKSINGKYKQMSAQEIPLLQTVKSDYDKRMNTYKLNLEAYQSI